MKFTPGPIVSALSGSIGGTTLSHNRGGQYARRRAIPVTSYSVFALAAKARLATASSAWQALTDGQRNAWLFWAVANPTTDALGQSINLTGQNAFVGNHILMLAAGQTPLDDPPILPAPNALTSAVQSGDIGTGGFDLTFLPTPLAADEYIWLQAAVTNSAGINYVQSLLRFAGVGAAAETSPYDDKSIIEARMGSAVVGQKLTVFARVFSDVTGMYSQPIRASVLIEDTP